MTEPRKNRAIKLLPQKSKPFFGKDEYGMWLGTVDSGSFILCQFCKKDPGCQFNEQGKTYRFSEYGGKSIACTEFLVKPTIECIIFSSGDTHD
jgi:hypothetical protein